LYTRNAPNTPVSTLELPQLSEDIAIKTSASSSTNTIPTIADQPQGWNICAIQSTPDPKVFVFRCTVPRCRRRTFSRWHDFHRYYTGTHAAEKTAFWCPIPECNRSEGKHPFPRKDKMMVQCRQRSLASNPRLIEHAGTL
jgi:hypothetical protein